MGILDKFRKNSYNEAVKKALDKYEEDTYHRTYVTKQQDASPSSSSRGGASLVVGLAKRLGLRFGDVTSSDFEDPEYDLNDIDDAYDSDSYVRQGIDKYVEQMFKEGYGFYGNNPSAVEYIETRIRYASVVTQIPFETLLIQMADSIVKYSNCILAKSRLQDQSQLPQGVAITGIDGKEPIVGYFPVHPGTLKAKRDKNGTIKGWQQEIDGAGKAVKFKAEDIIHVHYKQRIGFLYGTPFLVPVLDDIKALRFLEENCINMVYKNVNPFLHTQVGYETSHGTEGEINTIKSELEGADVDSSIITTNRVTITAVETNKSVNAEPYLRYLEERVFSGLGIPAVKFGRGDTSNRSTADSMTDEMSDRIKAFQQAVETGINNQIIYELLIEGGFDPLNNPDDVVTFEFTENDMDRKIKTEAHAVFMYENNAYDENEMRDAIGREPITDRAMMYQTLITQANAQFEASLTPATGTTGTQTSSSGKSSQASNIIKPTNQHGTKTSPKKNTNNIELILSNNVEGLAKEINVSEHYAKIIIKVFSNSINAKKLNNEEYIKYMNERIDNIVNVFNKKR